MSNNVPMFNVRDWGCVGDGIALDLINFQNCVNAVAAAISGGGQGGCVYAPRGTYNLSHSQDGRGLLLPKNVRLCGEGGASTILHAGDTDQSVVTVVGDHAGIERLAIYGKGVFVETGTFGASAGHPALHVTRLSVESVFRDLTVWGGYFSILAQGSDNYFENVNASLGYGFANVASNGADWYVRCKFDHASTGVYVSSLPAPLPTAWKPNAPYGIRSDGSADLVLVDGILPDGTASSYLLQYKGLQPRATGQGMSGATLPALKNYNVDIYDGNMIWWLLSPAVYFGMEISGGCGENHLAQTDFSGSYTSSVRYLPTAGGSYGQSTAVLTDCVLSAGASLDIDRSATPPQGWFCMRGCQVSGDILLNNYNGACTIEGNWAIGSPVTVRGATARANTVVSNNINFISA